MTDWGWLIVLFFLLALGLTYWLMNDLEKSVQRRRAARHRAPSAIDPAALQRITDSFAKLQASMMSMNRSFQKAGEALAGMRDAIIRAEDDSLDK